MTHTTAPANRLIREPSPYLRQHAHNPVDWYPWGEESLRLAVRDNRPILLSIGYSACHWCHVMEQESFEDPQTAALMNALFVNIKVDREERPDLDRVYQLAHQILTQRRGGWPLTVFLTPRDRMPFFAGTYFPPEPRHGLPAFRELLTLLARFHQERGEDIHQQNTDLTDILNTLNAPAQTTVLDANLVSTAERSLLDWMDPEEGGFGQSAKFPNAPALRLLLPRTRAFNDRESDATARAAVRQSLDAMALRGLWDHIGEGFFRYTIDAYWRIPHFEKMLYDNAQLLALYSEAATVFQDSLYSDRALGIVRWAMRETRDPGGGGFYASLDADSGGEEGAYYLWNRQDVETALPPRLWAWCAPAWGLNAAPNFEHRAWHLQLQAPIGVLAQELALPPDKLVAGLLEARNILRPLRDQRPPVHRDEKILTGWNGLMISALALTARKLGAPELAETALNGLRALRADVWRDGRLFAVHAGGDAYLPAYLDDYAFLADAALAVSEACGSAEALRWAIEWAEGLIKHFQDIENGGFFFTAHDHETLIHRPKPFADEATPAGNAVAARTLQRLGWLLAEPRYLAAAESTLQAGAESLRRMPHAHASLALTLQEFLHPPILIVLRGAAPAVRDWQQRIQTAETSAVMIFAVSDPAGDWPDALSAKPAQGTVCAYLCRGMQCEEAPYHDLAVLLDRLSATLPDCATSGRI